MIKVSIKACVALLAVAFLCCRDSNGVDKYEELVKSEMATGRRADSIFFCIYLGMTSKQFYTYCWQMNKKGLFTDGQNNASVLYRLDHNELKFPASMNFYPEFDKDKINKMGVTFQYDGWAPWNKHLFSDKLLPQVLNLYKRWYANGNAFMEIKKPGKNSIYVKVDGNRRIILSIKDDMLVKVDYTDLSTEEKNKK